MGERRRPFTVFVAAILLAVCAGCAVTFGVLTARQVDPFTARAVAVDPNGPETQVWVNSATASLWLIAFAGFVTALILLILAIVLFRPVTTIGGRARWITVIVASVLTAIVSLYTAVNGGIGFHLDAVPHYYDGDNMAVLRLPHSFQSAVVGLDAVMVPLLIAVVVLITVPVTARYFRPSRRGFTVDPYADYLQRQRGESGSREDHAG